MAELTLTPRAEADLFDIWATIALDNVPAADALFHRIMKKARLAASGRRSRSTMFPPPTLCFVAL